MPQYFTVQTPLTSAQLVGATEEFCDLGVTCDVGAPSPELPETDPVAFEFIGDPSPGEKLELILTSATGATLYDAVITVEAVPTCRCDYLITVSTQVLTPKDAV